MICSRCNVLMDNLGRKESVDKKHWIYKYKCPACKKVHVQLIPKIVLPRR